MSPLLIAADGIAEAACLFARDVPLRLLDARDTRTLSYDGTGWTLDAEPVASGSEWDCPIGRLRIRQPHPWTPTLVVRIVFGRRPAVHRLLAAAGPIVIGHESDAHLHDAAAGETITLFAASDRHDVAGEGQELSWRRFDPRGQPSDSVNRIAVPTLIETATLRLRIGPLATDG